MITLTAILIALGLIPFFTRSPRTPKWLDYLHYVLNISAGIMLLIVFPFPGSIMVYLLWLSLLHEKLLWLFPTVLLGGAAIAIIYDIVK